MSAITPLTNREKKIAKVEQIRKTLITHPFVYFFDFSEIENEEILRLRREIRKNNSSFKFYKNTLSTRALSLAERLRKHNALVFCPEKEEDYLKIWKTVEKFTKGLGLDSRITGACHNSAFIPARSLEKVAKLPEKKVFLNTFCYLLKLNVIRLLNVIKKIGLPN